MKISICIPFHFMDNWQFFLTRCLESIESQTFKDYEVILMKVDSMPITSNRVMEAARGELIKVLYLDDYLAHPNALQEIVDNFAEKDHWQVAACLHQMSNETPNNPHFPQYTDDIHTGNNQIGSPSVLTLRRESALFFDERLSWLLDCDLYKRLYEKYGLPKILTDLNVVIGVGSHQSTYKIPPEQKQDEHIYLKNKHGI